VQEIGSYNWTVRASSEGSSKKREKARKKAVEEFFAILFLYLVDHQKYGKIIKDMENEVLQKKDPFPKCVSDASRLLNGWHNKANLSVLRQMMVWHLPPCPRIKKDKINPVRRRN